MALATDRLTAHFTYGELRAHIAPLEYLANLRRTAEYLEVVRAILGVPLGRVSGWRSPARNEVVGGSNTSSHLIGLAADFTPLGLSQFAAYRKLRDAKLAGRLPPFDQIIYYPFGHIHVGLGARMRGQFLIRVSEDHYALASPKLASTLPGAGVSTPEPPTVLILFAIAFVALAVVFATNA